ncbi:Peptide chain release factor 1, mitochondrial [Diplodia seriata]
MSLVNDPTADAELRDLAADDLPDTAAQLERASQTLTGSLVPRHPFAHLPCMLEIRPGAGGSEAALFAADLLRMYQAYCARRGLRAHLVKYEDADGMGDPRGSDAPLQEAILEVDDDGAYARFRCEAGVHRVQRVPATESKGRTHTSSASVLVLPSFPEGAGANMDFEDPNSDYFIDPKEVRTDIMRASGAGGQHVNKTESAVRLTHVPTGTVAAIQDSRSQRANRDKAWQVLRSRIAQLRREAREEEALNLRRSVIGVAKMGREHKIRTYNWGQQRVTDHRSGLTIHGLDDVIEGGDNLEKAMESVRQWMSDQEVQQMVLLQESEEKK